MFQQFYVPHPALQGFVNNIMIHAVKAGAPDRMPQFSVPPLPEQALFFYVRDPSRVDNIVSGKGETQPPSLVVGPHVNRHIITPGRDHLMIKVGFQPGGLYRFLGIPMTELLSEEAFNGVDLIGREMDEVTNRLREATGFEKMKNIVECYLLKKADKLKEALPIDISLSLLIREGGLMKIDRLASHACLSIRQFERVFQQRIGLPPKHFSRMVRFAQAWIMKEQNAGISWIKIAHACGYFDQMHLIRDFQEFAAVNPSEIEAALRQSPVKFFNRLFS